MKPAAWIFLLFVISGGISALLGDTLGRRIGKRGWRIFKLRPKHTSTFMTVVLSMALSTGLFGFYLLFTRETGQILFNPEAALVPVLEKHQADLAYVNKVLVQRTKLFPPKLSQTKAMSVVQPQSTPAFNLRPILSNTPMPSSIVETKHKAKAIKSSYAYRKLLEVIPTAQPPLAKKQSLDVQLVEHPSLSPSTARVARAVGPRLAHSQSSHRSYQVLVPAQETLFSFETAGNLTSESAPALIAHMLHLTELYAEQLGIPKIEGSSLRVSPENIRTLQREMETGAHQLITVQTLHAVVNAQPMAVQLVSQALSQDTPVDPAAILEQARLSMSRQNLQQEVLPTIRSILAQRSPGVILTELPQWPEGSALVSPVTLGFTQARQTRIRESVLDPDGLRILLWIQP